MMGHSSLAAFKIHCSFLSLSMWLQSITVWMSLSFSSLESIEFHGYVDLFILPNSFLPLHFQIFFLPFFFSFPKLPLCTCWYSWYCPTGILGSAIILHSHFIIPWGLIISIISSQEFYFFYLLKHAIENLNFQFSFYHFSFVFQVQNICCSSFYNFKLSKYFLVLIHSIIFHHSFVYSFLYLFHYMWNSWCKFFIY